MQGTWLEIVPKCRSQVAYGLLTVLLLTIGFLYFPLIILLPFFHCVIQRQVIKDQMKSPCLTGDGLVRKGIASFDFGTEAKPAVPSGPVAGLVASYQRICSDSKHG